MTPIKTSRLLAPLALLTLGIRAALAADPAALSVVLFDDRTPLAGAEVRIDGQPLGRTNDDGALRLSIDPGRRTLTVTRDGREVLTLELEFQPQESAELIATLYPDSPPSVFIESSHQAGTAAAAPQAVAGPPGVIEGRVIGSEDGRPVAGARIFVSGTPLDVVTDADGRFRIEVAAGTYAFSVIAPAFSAQTVEGVVVDPEQTVVREIELTPAGLELAEFVVLEPYIEGSLAAFVEERRTSAAVTDILGAEQISRAGDSDAAGALKRVTGLTLVDGKYVYVRGLGERYSSVLLNGAQIPSPDPTRRVVPLDLFPTEILQGVVVQKTYSADMPGEFGGGSIALRTRGFPDSPFFKLSGSLGYADGTSFRQGFGYAGGGRDWTGKDDGGRALPARLDALRRDGLFLRQRTPANPAGLTPQEFEAVGEALAAGGYDITGKRIGPDGGFALSGGSSWNFGQAWRVGFLASARYSRSFDTRTEARRFYTASSDGLNLRDDTTLVGTRTEIDSSGFLVAGIDYGDDHSLRGTSLIVRQTEDLARIQSGVVDSQPLENYKLAWVENELVAHQLTGGHRLPWFVEQARVDWLYTRARANRYAPNTREYRFDVRDDGRFFSLSTASNSHSFANLDDDSESGDLGLALPFAAGARVQGELGLKAGRLQRERDSYIRRYQFFARGASVIRPEVLGRPTLEAILNPDTIRPDGFVVAEITQPTDNYFASQRLDYRAISLDLNLWDRLRLNFGLREEDNRQEVTTFSVVRPSDRPVIGLIDQIDRLPSFAATWQLTGNQQLRLGYSRTLSRPDFRELTAAPFVDPILDVLTFGNPELVTASIRNYDLRWEYYFSPTESVSVAAFRKDFTNPIEKQLLPGSGSILLTLANAEGATNQGVELDAYKHLGFLGRWIGDARWAQWLRLDRLAWENWYLGANYAWIDSEIRLDPARSGFNTNLVRPLEGQSPYVVNLQLGYQSSDGDREATLLYNVSGERIVQVGVDTQPDTYEQPFHQLDFTWKQRLGEHWAFRVRLRNLLDPRVEFRQGNERTREYRKGRELALSLEWAPF